ncbi:uncharacterized protein LOC143608604 [Bidens hawaiensis]|uniref:uncharacterized protein LOC143608604 n=1 Tax=Bidens hawaiensis TaxID=980011 RepID=UPI00404B07CB
MNKAGIEGDHMIISSGPAMAFLNRLPYIYQREDCDDKEFELSYFIPICFPSQSSCIGVLELTSRAENVFVSIFISEMIRVVKEAGLDVIHVQDRIPYKTINGLELAKGEIEGALKVVCESHNLALAQVWIASEDKSRVLSSSPLEDPHMNRLLAIKLTGYLYAEEDDDIDVFLHYFSMCDVGSDGFPVLETLQDYGSRYISVFHSNMSVVWNHDFLTSAFTICLRSNNTGVCQVTSYKFASGIELGDELDVIVAQSSTQSKYDRIGEATTLNIFRGKRSTPMPKPTEEGTKAKVGDYIAPSRAVCKTLQKYYLE